jgi:undecaprenyl-diphosphatase
VRTLLLSLAPFLFVPLASAQSQPGSRPPEPALPVAELSVADAIVFGVVEGVTEFLPISSTGHLIIATRVLGLESDKQLRDASGHPLWLKPPAAERKEGRIAAVKRRVLGLIGRKPAVDHPEGVPLTVKLAADTYNVVIQFGAIAAVAFLYWRQLLSMLFGLLGRDPAGLHLLVNILLAFVPTAIVGVIAHDWIEAHLFSVGAVIVAQVAGAGVMLFAERWRRRHFKMSSTDDGLDRLAPHAAAGIGALQVLSMWPGTSRSMTTIVGGYFAGLSPKRAAEFSFLLGFASLSGATVYKSFSSGTAMIEVFGWPHVLLGAAVAAVTAAVCVRFLVGWLTRHGLAAFAYYRLALATLLGALLATGLLQ